MTNTVLPEHVSTSCIQQQQNFFLQQKPFFSKQQHTFIQQKNSFFSSVHQQQPQSYNQQIIDSQGAAIGLLTIPNNNTNAYTHNPYNVSNLNPNATPWNPSKPLQVTTSNSTSSTGRITRDTSVSSFRGLNTETETLSTANVSNLSGKNRSDTQYSEPTAVPRMDEHRSVSSNTTDLRICDASNVSRCQTRGSVLNISEGTAEDRGVNTRTAGNTTDTRAVSGDSTTSTNDSEMGILARLEDSITVGRCEQTYNSQLRQDIHNGIHSELCGLHQGIQTRPVSPGHVSNGGRRENTRVFPISQQLTNNDTYYNMDNEPVDSSYENDHQREHISELNKKRSSRLPYIPCNRRESGSEDHTDNLKTQNQQSAVSYNHGAIHTKQEEHCSDSSNFKSDEDVAIFLNQHTPTLHFVNTQPTPKNIPWPGKIFSTSRIPHTPEEKSAPLHSKKVNTLNYDRILQVAHSISEEKYQTLKALLRWNTDPEMYNTCTKQDISEASPTSIPDTHIQQLLKDNIIETTSRQNAHAFGKVFEVYEENKHRLRVIFWPKHVNNSISYTSNFSLHSTAEQLQQLDTFDQAVAFDLTAGYYQCQLHPEVRKFFCFADKHGNIYQFTRMVMGFAPAAEVMHSITDTLATAASERTTVTLPYIDNVRFGDSTETLNTVKLKFEGLCRHCQLTLNAEPVNEIHEQGVFLGVENDYKEATSKLTSKTLAKLYKAKDMLLATECTIAQMFQAFGILFFASTVLRFPLHRVYHAFKFYRRRAHAFSIGSIHLNHKALVWNCIRKELEQWFDNLLQNIPASWATPRSELYHLFTDASLTGWGAVLFTPDNKVLVVSGRWSKLIASRRIEELEAMAIGESFTALQSFLQSKRYILHIDNTSVQFAIQKGFYSTSYNLNSRLQEIYNTLSTKPLALERVSSKANPADVPSRFPN